VYTLFKTLVAFHIIAGATGLVSFWAPVLSRKGAAFHVKWGRVFVVTMLVTGSLAVLISLTTLAAPRETHPDIADEALIRGIFGWMMLYLGILTVTLAWYGRLTVKNRRSHFGNRTPLNLALHAVLLAAAANCLWQGLHIGQVLMVGISMIGFATVATNGWFLWQRQPAANAWQKEHIKALVGAGISVYTAFSAFGAVRIAPHLALNPVMWSIPLVVGISLILYFWWTVSRPRATVTR
jgi:hypothetical protein